MKNRCINGCAVFRNLTSKATPLALLFALQQLSQAAVIFSNTAAYDYTLSDSVSQASTGEATLPNSGQQNIDVTYSELSNTVTFKGNVDANPNGSSLGLNHQHDGQVPNFPSTIHSIDSTFQQHILFTAEDNDGSLSIAGTMQAYHAAGTDGLAKITVILRDITAMTDLLDTSATNSALLVAPAAIALTSGHQYELIIRSENQQNALASGFGGTISSGGTFSFSLLGGGVWTYSPQAIPEPSAVLSLALAAGLGLLRRRRA